MLRDIYPLQPGFYGATVCLNQEPLAELKLSVPGMFNLMNALAAFSACHQSGVPPDKISEALGTFQGMGRRFEKVAEINGVLYFDDYGHHPTEVQATLKASRDCLAGTDQKVAVVFQPHRYTRLQTFWDAFVVSFEAADIIHMVDVYGAGEVHAPGLPTSEHLYRAIQQKFPEKLVQYYPGSNWPEIRRAVLSNCSPGDWAISMGAGSITQLFREGQE